jgi:hypothetical protein
MNESKETEVPPRGSSRSKVEQVIAKKRSGSKDVKRKGPPKATAKTVKKKVVPKVISSSFAINLF